MIFIFLLVIFSQLKQNVFGRCGETKKRSKERNKQDYFLIAFYLCKDRKNSEIRSLRNTKMRKKGVQDASERGMSLKTFLCYYSDLNLL